MNYPPTHAKETARIGRELAQQMAPHNEEPLSGLAWVDALVRRTGGEHWWTGRTDNMGVLR